ncbi:MAG TPA: 5'/3'-nucleotidase SurE [Opitutaceae bacterium]
MRLLLTNDDGIESPFLHVLAAELRSAGHDLSVVAPRREQSWVGAAKSRNRAVHSAAADVGLGCRTWIVDGTPSDCVNIALDHLLTEKPEGVVSGINVGLNASLGFIIASGTVAGAWEGALHGLPAIALSQDLTFEMYDHLKATGGRPDPDLAATLAVSARHSARLVPDLLATSLGRPFLLHNVNFPYPCRADTPVQRTVPAHMLVPRLFSPQADDGTHRLIFRAGDDVSPEGLITDRDALVAGRISHSVLDFTRLGVPPS